MNITRNGKIARLPKAVRDELNQRLADGEPGNDLVIWLNALPEVKSVLAKEFNRRPIREQNLSEWKQGGYGDWERQQEALKAIRHFGVDATELSQAAGGQLTDQLAVCVAARIAVALKSLASGEGDPAEQFTRLRELCGDLVALRRGDHDAEWLRLERERLENSRKQSEKKLEEQFWEWAMDPDRREQICRGFKTQAEKIEILRKIMFGDAAPEVVADESIAGADATEGSVSAKDVS